MKKTTLTGYALIAVAILLAPWLYSYAACTPLGSVTSNFALCKPAVGETGWGTVVNANMDTIDANLTNSLPRNYLSGFGLSDTPAATPTKIDIAPGIAQDAGQLGALSLAASITKDLSAAWAVGSNQGCLGPTVNRTVNTWYHVFIIKRTDTSVVDAYCDTNVNAANIPSPYTLYRRVGSIRTDGTGSGNIIQFSQNGPEFLWSTPIMDLVATAPASTAVQNATLTVAPGVKVNALTNWVLSTAGINNQIYVSSYDTADLAPSLSATPMFTSQSYNTGNAIFAMPVNVRTSTTATVRYRLLVNNAAQVTAVTLGWIDSLGKN